MKLAIALALTLNQAQPFIPAASEIDLHNASCIAPKGSHEADLCDVFITGIVLGIISAQKMHKTGTESCLPNFDTPKAPTLPQAIEIVQQFMLNHPMARGGVAADNVWNALNQAYPCGKSN